MMNILVCMKQVPASSQVEIDQETGSLKRLGAESRTNPYDLYALETALSIKELLGGKVTVLTMGPPQAEQMVRDAFMMGADDGVILSDRKFAGSDVLATSYTLAQGIELIGSVDLVLCGRQTTDGDTAQIGPAIAERLGLPHAAWVNKIQSADREGITIVQVMSGMIQHSRLKYPCLLTMEKDCCVPRLPSYRKKRESAERQIRFCSFQDLPRPDLSRCGLVGSPTQVEAMFAPPVNEKRVVIEGNVNEKAAAFVKLLKEKKLIEGGVSSCQH